MCVCEPSLLAHTGPKARFGMHELQILLKQFEDWKKDNKGSFSDFMKDKSDPPIKQIKLANGGSVEDYSDLIDAYTKGIDVLPDETLTQYINRIRAAEAKKDD